MLNRLGADTHAPRTATWRSGYAAVCKTVYPGSIPGVASKFPIKRPAVPVVARLRFAPPYRKTNYREFGTSDMFDSAVARRVMVDCQVRTADVTSLD